MHLISWQVESFLFLFLFCIVIHKYLYGYLYSNYRVQIVWDGIDPPKSSLIIKTIRIGNSIAGLNKGLPDMLNLTVNSRLLFSFQIRQSLERLRLSGMAKISFLVLGAQVSQTFNLFHCHVFVSMNSDTLADSISSPMNTGLWDNQREDDTSIFVPSPPPSILCLQEWHP